MASMVHVTPTKRANEFVDDETPMKERRAEVLAARNPTAEDNPKAYEVFSSNVCPIEFRRCPWSGSVFYGMLGELEQFLDCSRKPDAI